MYDELDPIPDDVPDVPNVLRKLDPAMRIVLRYAPKLRGEELEEAAQRVRNYAMTVIAVTDRLRQSSVHRLHGK